MADNAKNPTIFEQMASTLLGALTTLAQPGGKGDKEEKGPRDYRQDFPWAAMKGQVVVDRAGRVSPAAADNFGMIIVTNPGDGDVYTATDKKPSTLLASLEKKKPDLRMVARFDLARVEITSGNTAYLRKTIDVDAKKLDETTPLAKKDKEVTTLPDGRKATIGYANFTNEKWQDYLKGKIEFAVEKKGFKTILLDNAMDVVLLQKDKKPEDAIKDLEKFMKEMKEKYKDKGVQFMIDADWARGDAIKAAYPDFAKEKGSDELIKKYPENLKKALAAVAPYVDGIIAKNIPDEALTAAKIKDNPKLIDDNDPTKAMREVQRNEVKRSQDKKEDPTHFVGLYSYDVVTGANQQVVDDLAKKRWSQGFLPSIDASASVPMISKKVVPGLEVTELQRPFIGVATWQAAAYGADKERPSELPHGHLRQFEVIVASPTLNWKVTNTYKDFQAKWAKGDSGLMDNYKPAEVAKMNNAGVLTLAYVSIGRMQNPGPDDPKNPKKNMNATAGLYDAMRADKVLIDDTRAPNNLGNYSIADFTNPAARDKWLAFKKAEVLQAKRLGFKGIKVDDLPAIMIDVEKDPKAKAAYFEFLGFAKKQGMYVMQNQGWGYLGGTNDKVMREMLDKKLIDAVMWEAAPIPDENGKFKNKADEDLVHKTLGPLLKKVKEDYPGLKISVHNNAQMNSDEMKRFANFYLSSGLADRIVSDPNATKKPAVPSMPFIPFIRMDKLIEVKPVEKKQEEKGGGDMSYLDSPRPGLGGMPLPKAEELERFKKKSQDTGMG